MVNLPEVRKPAVGAIRQLAERAAILAQIADGVVLVNAEASITFVNDAARWLDDALLPGMSLAAYAASERILLLDGRPYPFWALPAVRALAGEQVIGVEARLRRTAGAGVLVRSNASPLQTANGRRLGAVWVLQNITAEADQVCRTMAPDFRAGDLTISFPSQQVTLDGTPVKLTPLEYQLLLYLVQNAGRVLPARLLLDRVWNQHGDATRDTLKVYISRLRAKIDPQAMTHPIETVRGLGYRYVPPALHGTPGSPWA